MKRTNIYLVSLFLVCILWLVFSIVSYFRGDNTLWILIPQITFLIVSSINYNLLSKESKKETEQEVIENEFKKKMEWETFNSNLYKKDKREGTDAYEEVLNLLKLLDSKKNPKDEELEKIKKEMESLKEETEEKIWLEIIHKIKTKYIEHV